MEETRVGEVEVAEKEVGGWGVVEVVRSHSAASTAVQGQLV
jgi:hypothetical protein